MKLYTKCANCNEIVTETFNDEGCNMQAVLKSASINHNCKQTTVYNPVLNATVEEEQEESAFITLQRLRFGDIR